MKPPIPSAPGCLVLLALLLGSCTERGQEPAQPSASGRAPSPPAPAVAAPPEKAAADAWLVVTKDGRELGVVELLVGKPWRLILHSGGDEARALEKLVQGQGGKAISLRMHLPPDKPGERGPYGAKLIEPGDPLYRFAVEDLLSKNGFTADRMLPRFEDTDPPKSVSKLELSRDGAKVGTLDLASKPPKLALVDRQANALFLETFWQGLEREEELTVSYLSPSAGKDTLVTASAKKGSPAYANVVRLAFAVRYPAYGMVVIP